MRDWLDLAAQAAREAGAAVLAVQRGDLAVTAKEDGSPLTLADRRAHAAIMERLVESAIAVVSEEGGDLHLDAERYWLVDPLDGTKDFLAGNGEFTVNVALVEGGAPLLGVVYAPALGELYAGAQGVGAWMECHGARSACAASARSPSCRMAVSRFHDHGETDGFASANRIEHRVAMGSALKFGRLAMGAVDVYPRLAGSSEWDTAAGQAVVESAGGAVVDWNTGAPLRYGKPARRNPRLLALRAPYTPAEFQRARYEGHP